MSQNINMAVLIDGDNIPSANVKEMMEEIAKYGNPTIRTPDLMPKTACKRHMFAN